MKTTLLMCLLSLAAWAVPPNEGPVLLTLKGSLTAKGKPVTVARFQVTPSESHLVLELDKTGKFEVKAVASREYVVDIEAEGHAPLRRTIELDERGVGELGAVKLDPLKRAKATVVVAPRGSLAGAVTQELELRHGSCANVRAQDDSGCLLTFCVNQEGPQLQIPPYNTGGQPQLLGKMPLAGAEARLPKGTFVTGEQSTLPLREGETWAVTLRDPYCAALLHVDEVK